ncbi:MAG: c-type cytochrome [Anaerolineales bacterium]
MKLRQIALLIIFAALLSACNFTLAEDVTPPPGYIPPTPAPTLGPLFPAQAPNIHNGAAIYVEKCQACHGETGMGDGPQGIQLGVTVPAYGLPEVARAASPAQWYEVVTRGRMDRFMPPFSSLNDQERWDVVGYISTLHTTPEQIEQGKQLFEANCANCSTDFFTNQEKMSALTEVELARLAKQGNDQVPAFGANLSQDELWAVAVYLRSLTFASASTTEAAAVTETPAATEAVTPATEAGTPSGEGTPVEGTPQAEVTSEATVTSQPGFGTVSGAVDNQTGEALPADAKVTLHGYEHGADPSTGPQEVVTLEGALDANGNYSFPNVEIPANRIFIAEVSTNGMTQQSQFAVVAEGDTSVTIPTITLFASTTDLSALVMDEVRLFVEYGDTDVQIYGVYAFRNTGDKTIVVDVPNGTDVPFIKMPEGVTAMGFQALQDSEKLVTTDNGFAIPPSQNSYGLITISTTPKADKINVSQSFVLPASVFTLLVPEGTKADATTLTDQGLQTMQNFNFQVYGTNNVKAGDTLKFTVTGTPKESTSTTTTDTTTPTSVNQNWLIGAGAAGVALILAGAWMYLRDRSRLNDEEDTDNDAEENNAEFDTAEEVMDAIIALDDQHHTKKISDEAYQRRRAELKNILKGMM